MGTNRRWIGAAVVLLLALALWLAPHVQDPAKPAEAADDLARIASAFAERRSDLWVESAGTVLRTLRDDLDGSPHQRFVVELPNGQTLLVAHNIDLAPRVPLRPGDRIAFRGEYEWNERGGVIHWTHHDPDGRHEGGWLEHGGKRYR